MKPKHIITLTACLFFLFTSLSAMAGERMQIEIDYTVSELHIYEKGNITTEKINMKKTYADLFKWQAEVVEKYLAQGYKIVTSTTMGRTYFFVLEKP